MKVLSRLIIFYICFCAEIRIHAEEVVSANCKPYDLGHQIDCFLLNPSNHILRKTYGNTQVFGGEESVYSIDQNHGLAFVNWIKGEGVLQSKKKLVVKSQLASFRCIHNCVAAFQKPSDHLEFHALRGQWEVIDFAEKSKISIQEGQSVLIGRVNQKGESDMSLPYSMTDHEFSQLERLYLSEFSQKERKHLQTIRKKALSELSRLYQDRALASITEHKSYLERRAAQRQAEESERRRLLKLFREKSLLD